MEIPFRLAPAQSDRPDVPGRTLGGAAPGRGMEAMIVTEEAGKGRADQHDEGITAHEGDAS